MAVDAALAAAMAKVDATSNSLGGLIQPIADRLAALAAKLDGSMSAAEQTAAASSLQADSDKLDAVAAALTALGADPANPTPPVTTVR